MLMKKMILTSTLALFCGYIGLRSFAQTSPPAGKLAADVTAAANKFLATLDDGQRAKAVYRFDDEAQRKRWSNLPTSMVKRGGLRMGDLTKQQRDTIQALLNAALS